MLAHNPQRPRTVRRAAATVEFAVVIPVLLVFVLGIIEIGRLVMVAQVNTNAAREGARYAAQGSADSATVDTYVRTYLTSAGVSNAAAGTNSAVTVTIEAQSGSNSSWVTVSDPSTQTAGTPIRVTVSANFNQQSWLPTRFFIGNNTQVQGVAVMRKE
jgi:Flp pilus assembly protein TadG